MALSLNWRQATVRAVRTFFQAFAGGLVGIPIADTMTDVLSGAQAIGFAAWAGFLAALIAFAQNLAEDNTRLKLPK